jgi:hypothetical protein
MAVYGLEVALMFDAGASRSATYTDLLSSGQLRLIRDEELRARLSKYDELQQKGNLIFAQFWEGQRLHEIAFSKQFTYVTERRRNGQTILNGKIASYDFEGMLADLEFQQATQRLTEYQIYYQIWHTHLDDAANAVQDMLP